MENLHFLKKIANINTFVFDVDGVFTNNQLLATETGDMERTFNAKDGFALKTAIQKGYKVCIITGGTSQAVHKRFELLGVHHNYFRINDKLKVLKEFLAAENILSENVLYTGDDIPDFHAMNFCGLKCCPNDAVPEIKHIADYICRQKGGDAAVREVIEMVLKVQDNWFAF